MKINFGFLAHIANVISGAVLRAESSTEPKAREMALGRIRALAGGRLPAEVRGAIEEQVNREWVRTRASTYDQHNRFRFSRWTTASTLRATRAAARKGAGFGETESPASRLGSRTVREVGAADCAAGYRRASSAWEGGENTILVRMTDLLPPGVSSDVSMSYHASKVRSGRNLSVVYTVPRRWLRTVGREGLATVGGMVTLTADTIHAPEGFTAWSAAWVEQGRGLSRKTVSGVIVCRTADGEFAHGATLHAALATLARRGRPAHSPLSEGEKLTRAIARANQHREVLVRFEDSTAAGNCESGARDWCQRWMLVALHRGWATVGEILDTLGGIAQGDRASMALAACLYAVRRASREQRAA